MERTKRNPNASNDPTLGSTINIASANLDELAPDIAQRLDDQMIVTFHRNSAPQEVFDFDVIGQDVDVSPLSLVGAAFTIAADLQGNRQRFPTLKCSASTTCQVAYRFYDDTQGADRVRGRVLGY